MFQIIGIVVTSIKIIILVIGSMYTLLTYEQILMITKFVIFDQILFSIIHIYGRNEKETDN
jgi:hypothetical protein